jgi:hypothetical protein
MQKKKSIQTDTRNEHDGTIQYDPQEYMARELLFDFYSVSALVVHSSYTCSSCGTNPSFQMQIKFLSFCCYKRNSMRITKERDEAGTGKQR